ncbi:hypothetical protein RDWZM_001969 [Blomia tropicalis]|uniref:Uncharacterized protein n=1 Tax=Blomia tropicalis TaxID=40697 RepID=A0A9Q0MCY9_BLOTA|nr:Ribonuclease H2 subunit C [Blomia tropicalis]KAJ6223424.1 hypothetical protein RDWZM_001969 [Blomia tropicalis]
MSFESLVVQRSQSKDDDTKHKLHLLNCKLEGEHENIPVSQYFTSQLQLSNNKAPNSSDNLKVSFRGRPLNGRSIKLPNDYFFARANKSENGNEIFVNEISDEVTYWNLDKLPSDNDPIPKVIEWLKVSSDIHAHVQLED